MKKSYEMKQKDAYAALGALLFAATISTPVSAEVPAITPFTMTVISDAAYGHSVVSGKYQRAIDKLTRDGRLLKDEFADQTNLCVAYTKTRDIQRASDACNAAIAHVKKREARVLKTSNRHSAKLRAYQSNLAVALSNRGVLLAATGDAELARQDFLTALDLQTRLSTIVEGNLQRLEQKSAGKA